MTESDRLLRAAADVLRGLSVDLIAVSPQLQVPFTDAPEWSPWTRTIGPRASQAHALAREIRGHLDARGN